MTRIFGIVNITRDSFSDGGAYLDPKEAIRAAHRLHAAGAAVIDLGAESTHPDSEPVSAADEIARLTPVATDLIRAQIPVSIDTHKPQVMAEMIRLGVDFINDVTALTTPGALEAVRDTDTQLVLMHNRATGARAQRVHADPRTIVAKIIAYFQARLTDLDRAGIPRERLILDPGMGFFLGANADASVAVLRGLRELRAALRLPLLVSTSRKSFLGALLAASTTDATAQTTTRPVSDRAAATLASELFAVQQGADFIRTHDVRTLADALCIWKTLSNSR